MGGLGPGIGGFEYLIIALVALLVVGPERLPLMLRKLGQWVAKARRMADEFRSSFDEMARQSELDELRKEVEALRRGQSNMMPLGPEAEATFRDIRDDLNRPLDAPKPSPALAGPEEWPDSAPVMEPLEAPEQATRAEPAAKPVRARRSKAAGMDAAVEAPARKASPGKKAAAGTAGTTTARPVKSRTPGRKAGA
ncbi:Sec-independent protein translocase protein TatB [Brevundimonas sp.]|uniref:Sec-independent protein translocase protein TatB n=1 Tax=Brevundimonas sp. TaxID=1871086 RepID=UPI0035B399E8